MSLFLSVVIKSYPQMAMRLSVILYPYFAFVGDINNQTSFALDRGLHAP